MKAKNRREEEYYHIPSKNTEPRIVLLTLPSFYLCNGLLVEMNSYVAAVEKPVGDDDAEEKHTTVIVKAANLSSKVRRRMYGRITSQLRSAKLRTRETVERLNFTVDLVISCFMSSTLVFQLVEDRFSHLMLCSILIHVVKSARLVASVGQTCPSIR